MRTTRSSATDMNKLEFAKNPNTPAETLAELAKDEDLIVRINVADNPNTPAETLAELAKDEDIYVRRRAASNPNTPMNKAGSSPADITI